MWEISAPKFEADLLNEKLRVAPWEGHRNFAYDLVRYLRPDVIVELGSHYGCSLFSFAQAIKDANLQTILYAVDTWKGDEHAGFYGEEVIELVIKTCEKFFRNINIRLLRKTFDEALQDFEDNSVDVIHIDGLHTYEAVIHDFYTWLPKLRNDGIVLFHDIHSFADYGSDYFWKEISSQYPNFSMKHSWGLGILFPKGDKLYRKLLDENFTDKLQIYEFKARYELESIKTNDLSLMVEERDKAIRGNEKMIQERDALISDQNKIIEGLRHQIATLESENRNREKEIQERDALITDQNKVIERLKHQIATLELENHSNGKMIQERDTLISNQNAIIEVLRNRVASLEAEKNEAES
jgi:hypothetical protein